MAAVPALSWLLSQFQTPRTTMQRFVLRFCESQIQSPQCGDHTEPHKSKCQYSEMQKIRDYNCEPQQGLVFPRSWQHEGQALTFAIPSPSFPRLCICQTLSARPIKCCPSWFLNPGNPWVLMCANSLMRLNMFDFLGMHILCLIQWGEGGFAILLQR